MTLYAHCVVVVRKDWHLEVLVTIERNIWLTIQERSAGKLVWLLLRSPFSYQVLNSHPACKTF